MLIQNKSNIMTSTVSNNTPNAGGSLTANHLAQKKADAVKFESLPKVLFGSNNKSNVTKTWKQYFTNIYNKIRDFLLCIVNTVKSCFKKPIKNQAVTETATPVQEPSVNITGLTPAQQLEEPIEESVQFHEMTTEERGGNIKRLVEFGKNGKTFNDLSIKDQRFLHDFLEAVSKQNDPDYHNIGTYLVDLFGMKSK